SPDLGVLPPKNVPYTARSLAAAALAAAEQLKIEPGTLVLCFGYSTKRWKTCNAAMNYIYAAKPAWFEINKIAQGQIAWDQIPGDSREYLAALLGL
ncbi:hypothetical protein L0244_08470, partial [bacterium]|nr:hypothetical protein [bacterium]